MTSLLRATDDESVATVVEIVDGVARRLSESVLGPLLPEMGLGDQYSLWEFAYVLVTGTIQEHIARSDDSDG